MPAAAEVTSVLDRQLLLQLGERLKRARLKRGLTTSEMAQQAGISRVTLSAVEAGGPTPTMGTYLRVMSVLGFSRTWRWSEARRFGHPLPATGGARKGREGGWQRRAASAARTAEPQRCTRKRLGSCKKPELIQQALDTLERWRAAGDSHSRFLWENGPLSCIAGLCVEHCPIHGDRKSFGSLSLGHYPACGNTAAGARTGTPAQRGGVVGEVTHPAPRSDPRARSVLTWTAKTSSIPFGRQHR